MKHFSLSKLNWVGFLTASIGILGLANQLDLSPEAMKVIMALTGILTIILRTFFSGTQLTIKKPEGDI
jgi:hypothetical protein